MGPIEKVSSVSHRGLTRCSVLFSEFGLTGQSLTGVGHKSRFSATSAATPCVGNVRKKGRMKKRLRRLAERGEM
jgi:hypothetical protein